MLRFTKKDLDDGYKDKRLNDDFFIDLIFDIQPFGYAFLLRWLQMDCIFNLDGT
jgi:hypothetical protein